MSNTDSRRFYTYLHFRKDTMQVFYVGKGIGRRAYHRSDRNNRWRNTADRHGYMVEIAAKWPTEREAFEHEVFLINTFRLLGHPLVNMTDGGEGGTGHFHSDETKQKKSESMIRHWADPEKHRFHAGTIGSDLVRKKMSDAAIQKWLHPEKRRSASEANAASIRRDEVRKKLSSARLSWWASDDNKQRAKKSMSEAQARPENKALMSERARSLWESDEYRFKMAKIHSSEGFKSKMSDLAKLTKTARSKPVICHQNGVVYPSTLDAAKQLEVHQANVSAACRGRIKSTGGYSFAFYITGQPTQGPV